MHERDKIIISVILIIGVTCWFWPKKKLTPKKEAEKRARKLLKKETSIDISYQELNELGTHSNQIGTGFMHAYLIDTHNLKTMTTTAKRDVLISLAKSDLFRDPSFNRFFFSDSKKLI